MGDSQGFIPMSVQRVGAVMTIRPGLLRNNNLGRTRDVLQVIVEIGGT